MSLSPDLGWEERGLWQQRGTTVLRRRSSRWAFFLFVYILHKK